LKSLAYEIPDFAVSFEINGLRAKRNHFAPTASHFGHPRPLRRRIPDFDLPI
jgi:hypothetical protein